MLKYSALLRDSIEKEKAGIAYCCPEADKKILADLLLEINHYAGTDFHYLAELDAFHIPGTGRIIAEYIERFSSESVIYHPLCIRTRLSIQPQCPARFFPHDTWFQTDP